MPVLRRPCLNLRLFPRLSRLLASDSSGFSNFAPTAQWRDELAGTDAWGPAWQRAGGEMHVVESKNAMRVFADLRQDSALRVRFRSQSDAAFLDLIQRLNKVGIGPRYVITVWTKEKLGGSLDILPLKKDGERRTLAPLKSQPPLGTGTEHTAELYAIGDRLTFFFDGQLLSEAQDTTFTEGFPGHHGQQGHRAHPRGDGRARPADLKPTAHRGARLRRSPLSVLA
jgi:hypothetical protein